MKRPSTQPVGAVEVLTVDDAEPFRGAARMLLAVMPGFVHAGEASSGEDGVRRARALQPDLVLLDLRMPGMDGLQTARRIRAVAPRAVIVLVSALELEGLEAAATSSGAVAFLPKRELSPAALRALWARHGHHGGGMVEMTGGERP